MRPAEHTAEAIIKAGSDLLDQGRKITGFALRQIVGGGNPARLKDVWDEHIERQGATPAQPVATLPAEVADEVAAVSKALTEKLAAFAVHVNDLALKAAGRQVEAEKRRADEATASAELEVADAAKQIEATETDRDTARAEVEDLKAKLVSSQAAQQAQAIELARVHERLTLTEQAARDAGANHVVEIERLTATNGKIETMQAQIADLMRSMTPGMTEKPTESKSDSRKKA